MHGGDTIEDLSPQTQTLTPYDHNAHSHAGLAGVQSAMTIYGGQGYQAP